jgi:hypothetical protein
LFFFEKHLREKRPERECRGIDRVVFLAEGHAFFLESRLDGFLGQHVGEGQTGF